jgi:predicted N-acetyltransferase YhbS
MAKSLSQTPAPKKDRIVGSKVNPKGSASSEKSAEQIKLSTSIIASLIKKLNKFKETHKTNKVSLNDLKAVYRRGLGAYSTSHRPNITRNGWAMGRVNAFLKKAGGGEHKKAYVQDDDLMKMNNGGKVKSDYEKKIKEAIKYVENSPKARMDIDFDEEQNSKEAIKEGKDYKRIFPLKSKPNSFIVKRIREGIQNKYDSFGIWNEKKKSFDYKYLDNKKYGDKSKEFDTLQIANYDDKGKIVGIIKIATSENKKDDVKMGATKLSVRQDYQNKGIASKLIEKAESEGVDFVEAIKNNNFTSKGRWFILSWLNKKLKNKKRFADGGEVESFYTWFCNWYKGVCDKIDIIISLPNEISGLKSIPYKEDNVVVLDMFRKIDQNIDAKPYLQTILDKADEYGITIYLLPDANYKYIDDVQYRKKITTKYLIDYYRRFGFELTPDKEFMKRVYKYADGGLLAPNGNESNLTPEQYKLVRTPEFKAWFGDWENHPEDASKVVDENGEPLVVYHGSPNNFNIFRKGVAGEIHFVDFKEYAKGFGNYIYECFLDIKTPYFIKYNYEEMPKGFDGNIFRNFIKSKYKELSKIVRYGILEPEQIKLADGSNTTFDANNPDIRYDEGGWIENKMELYHGGNLDEYNDIIAQKNGRYEYGAGLYLTTHQDTARKYAKGSRKLYKIIVEKGMDIHDATIDAENVNSFIKKYVISSKRKEISERLSKWNVDGKIKAYIFNNVILNEKGISPSNTKNLRIFLVDNGIDYEVVDNPFGWGETMIVLYNMAKIVNVEKLDKGVYADGGDVGQEITCRRCGWKWNTKDSEEYNKYICRCGFDNRMYYDVDPIGYADGGEVEEHNETYKKWRSLVNMSYGEIKKFYDSKEGKEAGLSTSEANKQGISSGRESARWIMKMKTTPKDKWTNEMWKWANKQISFISRMSGMQGELYDDKGNKTRKHTSLLIWGHNPKKNTNMKYEIGGTTSDGGTITKEGICKCIKQICPLKRRNQPRQPCINVGDICSFVKINMPTPIENADYSVFRIVRLSDKYDFGNNINKDYFYIYFEEVNQMADGGEMKYDKGGQIDKEKFIDNYLKEYEIDRKKTPNRILQGHIKTASKLYEKRMLEKMPLRKYVIKYKIKAGASLSREVLARTPNEARKEFMMYSDGDKITSITLKPNKMADGGEIEYLVEYEVFVDDTDDPYTDNRTKTFKDLDEAIDFGKRNYASVGYEIIKDGEVVEYGYVDTKNKRLSKYADGGVADNFKIGDSVIVIGDDRYGASIKKINDLRALVRFKNGSEKDVPFKDLVLFKPTNIDLRNKLQSEIDEIERWLYENEGYESESKVKAKQKKLTELENKIEPIWLKNKAEEDKEVKKLKDKTAKLDKAKEIANRKYNSVWDSVKNKFSEVFFEEEDSTNPNEIYSNQVKAREYKFMFDRYSKYDSSLSWQDAENKFLDMLTPEEKSIIKIEHNIKNVHEVFGVMWEKKILVKRTKYADGGEMDVLMQDTVQRMDNPNFADISYYDNGGATKGFKYSKTFSGITIYTNIEQTYIGNNYSPFEAKGSFQANVRRMDLPNIVIESKELERFNFKWGVDDWNTISKKLQQNNITELELFTVGDFVKTFELKPLSNNKMSNGGATDFGKVVSSSSRFKPRETIVFDPPLIGTNGNKLISYTWSYEWTEDFNKFKGETVSKRISDWTQAETNAETGRQIVHQYGIQLADGTYKTVSSETVPIVLGFLDKKQSSTLPNLVTASKTLAKQKMQLAILEAKKIEKEDAIKEIMSKPFPQITKSIAFNDSIRYTMGKVSVIDLSADIDSEISKERKEALIDSYVKEQLKEIGINVYENTSSYELKNRIQRQERKIQNILENKMEDGGDLDTMKMDADSYLPKIMSAYANGGEIDMIFKLNTPTKQPTKLNYIQQVLVRTTEFKKFFGDWEKCAESFLQDNKNNFLTHYKNCSLVIDLTTLEPQVVYHGTNYKEEFYTFDVTKKEGVGRPYGYFADNIEYSQNFTTSSQRGQHGIELMYKCFLNIRKPFMAIGDDFYNEKNDEVGWSLRIAKQLAIDKYGEANFYENLNDILKVVLEQIFPYLKATFEGINKPFWLLMARDTKKEFKYFLMSHGFDGVRYAEEFKGVFDVDNPAEFTKAWTIFDANQVKLADGRNINFDPFKEDIRYKDGGSLTELNTNDMQQENMSKAQMLRNTIGVNKFAEGGTVKGDGKHSNDAKKGGFFDGRSHAEGGIKAVNKDTGQMLEVEGNEVIINKRSVADDTKREFEGKMMTNREILSKINEMGGGVSFKEGGEINEKSCKCMGKKYKFGGNLISDYDIVKELTTSYNDVIKKPINDSINYVENLINKINGNY